VLQASSKDRRQIFEEVAGISRFRIKREEAARRLERVEQNLLRLADIVQELETRTSHGNELKLDGLSAMASFPNG